MPDDTTSGSNRRPATRRGLGGAVVIGMSALVVFVLASRPEAAPTTTTLPLALVAPVATTSTAPATPTTVAAGPTLDDLLPGLTGDLVSAISAPTGPVLSTWPARSEQTQQDIPMVDGPHLEMDVSATLLAFLGPSATDGDALYTGTADHWSPLATGVTSFRWHPTRPGALAWSGLEADLCRVDVDTEGITIGPPICISDVPGDLAAFDDLGFLMVDQGEVVRVTTEGEEIGRVPGTDAEVGPNGTVLVVDRAEDGSTEFSLAPPELGGATPIDWAPDNAAGEHGFVAWSPTLPLQLAFLTLSENGQYGLERWSVDGRPEGSTQIGARLWDVTWDNTGRYLVAPGEQPAGEKFVYVFDTLANVEVFIPFPSWVQDTQLVVEASCEEAGFLEEDWPPGRLSSGVGASGYRMVRSRQADFESLYFLSARLHGGDHDGEIATWALPGYPGEGEYVLSPIPVNDVALGRSGLVAWEPETYGVDDWMALDGAAISQWCAGTLDAQDG